MKKQSVTITGENLSVVVNSAAESASTSASSRMMSKAEMRIAALKARGVDTSSYFPLGTEQVVKIVDGNAVPVDMTDDVEKRLAEGGYINHYTLFRRWVMAQVLGMLRRSQQDSDYNITLQIRHRGYEYQWRVLEREFMAQAKMSKHGDKENLYTRRRWFCEATVSECMVHYVYVLKCYVERNLMYRTKADGTSTYKHKCKGAPYVRLMGKNIFVDDLHKKVYNPLLAIARAVNRETNAEKIHSLIVKFNSMRKKMKCDTEMCPYFIDSYKGSGAYFTCKNLIMFHGARFLREKDNSVMSEDASLAYLEIKADEYKNREGWRLFGVMKQLIEDSNISVEAKIAEWRK